MSTYDAAALRAIMFDNLNGKVTLWEALLVAYATGRADARG